MRIYDKIEEIEKYVQELEEIVPVSLHEYKSDFKSKAACERYFEKIIEAIIDLAFLIIKEKKYSLPEDDKKCFEVLNRNKIISSELANRLSDAKGMRNILAHEYGKIDDELVFWALTKEIIRDAKEFVCLVRKLKF